jgi:8-oxo-dGTP pyrophosphatase MutT (NUDIX family)
MKNWMDEMRRRLDRPWPERPLAAERGGSGAPLREAAVLVPLYVRDKELFTLFTERTDEVEHHKGQISFPGGGREEQDSSLWHTAVREAEEEIGVPRALVQMLGTLPRLVTVTDFDVHPYVGAMPYPIKLTPHEREVKAIIEIPIAYLLDPLVVEERAVTWKGRQIATLVYHYRGHAIWGATARILADFLTVLTEQATAPETVT